MAAYVIAALFALAFGWAIVGSLRDRKKVLERTSAKLAFSEDRVDIRATWRSALSWKVAYKRGDVRVTADEAYVIQRDYFDLLPQPVVRLVMRPELRPDRGAPGMALQFVSMERAGKYLIVETTMRFGTGTLRFEPRDPDGMRAALEAARDGGRPLQLGEPEPARRAT